MEQRFFETVFIARQDLTASQVENLAQQYTQIVRNFKGDVTKTEFCGLRQMAYPIKKNKKGHYILMNIACSIECITEVERLMKLNEDVLRYLSIRVEKLDNAASSLMQNKNFRDDYKGMTDDDDDLDIKSDDEVLSTKDVI